MIPDHWQQTIHRWNQAYPVGTRVVLQRHNHPDIVTTTHSHATIMQGTGPVIQLSGVIGSYMLHYVIPIDTPVSVGTPRAASASLTGGPDAT